jgi:hypothetical protein
MARHDALTGFLRRQHWRCIVAHDRLTVPVVGIPLVHGRSPTLFNIKGNVAHQPAVAAAIIGAP